VPTEANQRQSRKIQGILDIICRLEKSAISVDAPEVVQRLKIKLEWLEGHESCEHILSSGIIPWMAAPASPPKK